MSDDISSMYTKKQNVESGRRCYVFWKREKITTIPPNKYGTFLAERRRR